MAEKLFYSALAMRVMPVKSCSGLLHRLWTVGAFITLILAISQASAQETQLPSGREQMQLSFAPLVKKTAPAVVNIFTSKRLEPQISPFLSDPLFRNFLGGRQGRSNVQNSLGSGVIIKPEGVVVTNNHVIRDADEIRVVLTDKREYTGKVIMADSKSDIALIQLDTEGDRLPFIDFENSDTLEVGDLVLAIGNPFGVGQTVTSGIVSAVARTQVGISEMDFFIQTDAAINPGNSGGALVNMAGKLVGVNTAIFTRSGGSIGIGFAIPSNMVQSLLRGNNMGGKPIRPWLGASVQTVTKGIASAIGMKTPRGVIIKNVYPNSSAAKGGLLTGDVVLAVDDRTVEDDHALRYRIATYEVGKAAKFTINRKGVEQTLMVMMERATETPPRDVRELKGAHPLSGAVVANLSPALAEELGIGQVAGIAILEVQHRSLASKLGFTAGDIILAINAQKMKDTESLQQMLARETLRGWQITFSRGGNVLKMDIN